MARPDKISTLFGLQNKVSIVTGAGGAIGSGIAQLFADAGSAVVIADYNLAQAEKVAGTIGASAIALQFDQSDENSINAMIAAVEQKFGGLDVMVNCAAAFGFEPLEKMTEAEWNRIHGVNVRGLAFCCKAAVSAMLRRKGGSIVNISSIAGSRFVLYDSMAYASSKAANNAITSTIAREYADRGIRVNGVIPGAIENESPDPRAGLYPMRGPLMQPGAILLNDGKAGLPQDIATACLYLASDAGRYVTGQLITVDGGVAIA